MYTQKTLSLKHIFNVRKPDKCTIYPRSPLIGSVLLSLERNVKTAAENCYSSAVTHVVHATEPMLSQATKDLLPALQKAPSCMNTSATVTVSL